MLRLFVGIGFPPELKLRLSLLCSGISGASWVDPGNFHLTLRFIGEIDEDRPPMSTTRWCACARAALPCSLPGPGCSAAAQAAQPLGRGRARSPSCRLARQDRAGADPRRAAAGAAQIRAARHPGAAAQSADSTNSASFSRVHAQFRAEPLPVEALQPDRELSDQGRLGL